MDEKWRIRAKIVACIELTLLIISTVILVVALGFMAFALAHVSVGDFRETHDAHHDYDGMIDKTETNSTETSEEKFADFRHLMQIGIGAVVFGLLFAVLYLAAAIHLLKSTNTYLPPVEAVKKVRFWRNVKIISIVIGCIGTLRYLIFLQFPTPLIGLLVELLFLYIGLQHMKELRAKADTSKARYGPA